jgi:hypothetical protein
MCCATVGGNKVDHSPSGRSSHHWTRCGQRSYARSDRASNATATRWCIGTSG